MAGVLIVDLALRFGGADVRVIELAKSLHGQHPYTIATLDGSPLHHKLEAESLNALPVPYARSDPRTVLHLVRALRSGSFTVLDGHNPQSQFWGMLAALVARVPRLVVTVHSNYLSEHDASLKGRGYEYVLRLNAMRKHAHFVAVSESVQTYLQSIGVPADKISLIHNSLHVPQTAGMGRNHPVLVERGWQDDNLCLLVSVARLEPVKGYTHLLEAVRQVVPRKPQFRCLIVGEGRARADLEAQVQAASLHDHVHFAGFRTDVADLLNTSNMFCLASLTEGLPFALLEACALKVPPLVTAVGGMAELLTHQETAYLVPPENAEALAEGICWLIDHPAEAATIGQNGFALCQRKFSPETMKARTLEVYSL